MLYNLMLIYTDLMSYTKDQKCRSVYSCMVHNYWRLMNMQLQLYQLVELKLCKGDELK
jgi:hypothetical protein